LKKNPLRDLHRVAEHPADSTRSCLRLRIARRASKHSPYEGEGRKIKSLRGLSVEYLRRDNTVCARRLCISANVGIP
jgi:hypothetical protein